MKPHKNVKFAHSEFSRRSEAVVTNPYCFHCGLKQMEWMNSLLVFGECSDFYVSWM